ncbi:MAG TPA: carboxymuconolactone decarboxylase family protein [Trebonia sp.]|jgi:alkylhydroperoxidase family enzyme|nr:carboxymuconolactone decarboxylase family protein [Trebonia sp.]
MPFLHAADPRIAPVEDPGAEVSALLARTRNDGSGVPMSIFRTMARHPQLLEGYNVLADFFRAGRELSVRDRELVILRTAWRTGCEYEWTHHVRLGAEAGLSHHEMSSVGRPALAGDWPDRDAVLLRATDEILDEVDLSDATWAELSAGHTDAQIIELVMLVGFYRMVAGFLNATGVRQEERQSDDRQARTA